VALLRLLMLAGEDAPALVHRALSRFSLVALVAAGLVIASGIANAAFIIESPAALLGTGYGRMLLAKVVFAAGMVGLGALNRFVFLPALKGPDEAKSLAALRQSVAAEIGLGAAIIAVVATLGMLSPSQ
jgi:putative copper resistance protein D